MVIHLSALREACCEGWAAATQEGFKEAAWAVMGRRSDWSLWEGWRVLNIYYLLGAALGFFPQQLHYLSSSAMKEVLYSGLSNMVATSHMWLLSIWNVVSMTEELNFDFI